MASIRLGVRCERQSEVFFGLARKPFLLFRHRGGVRREKSKSVESIMQYENIQLSRLRAVNALPRFVETLQGKCEVSEIGVRSYTIRRKAKSLPCNFRGFFILPLFAAHQAPIAVGPEVPRVALNHFLICRDRFIQFAGYLPVVLGGDIQ